MTITMLQDQLKRPLRDLRISVTDRCNFRCQYCMPAEIFGPDYPFLKSEQLLTFDEIERLVKIFVSLGVKKIRFTGGEPLLRPRLSELIERIAAISGVEDLALTTNGSLLKKHAEDLAKAGLKRVSVSLDSLDEGRFSEINGHRGSVKAVLEGIEKAHEAGLKVKVNMVVKRGANEEDIVAMAKFFKERKQILRFIEYMDVGNTNGWKLDEVVTKQEILEQLNDVFPLKPIKPNYRGEVAKRYQYLDGDGEIGVISSVTEPFCATCTRARLSAEGKMYTCLFASSGTDLRSLLRNGADDETIQHCVINVWENRKDRYSEERNQYTKNKLKVEMSHIGG